ncbi:MAG: polysaccharide deacetylase family protein, partial [Alkalibacterium sp.]|nr:polysaccharide deacetylase family protein [Alkalibacterium sp.]
MKLILLAMLFIITAGCADNQVNQTADAPEETDTEESVNQEQDDQESDEIGNEEHVDDESDEEVVEEEPAEEEAPDYDQLKGEIVEQFENATPTDWGENVEGVVTEIDTDDKVVALTFDACDATPDSYDAELIDFLIEEDIPATLFINAQWIEEHEDIFLELAENPLFEIANHGYYHKPLSVDGE